MKAVYVSPALSALHDRKPLVWAGGGYGGQVAVRFDSKKVIRRNLFPGKKPDNWEVYDIVKDPAEKIISPQKTVTLSTEPSPFWTGNINPRPASRPCVTRPRNR